MIDYRENANWKVYAHINRINGKIYIGQTKRKNPEQRWKTDGRGYSDSKYFWNAIKKYGWDNFDHQIIAQNLTKEEADDFETSLISLFKSNKREYGYNIANGGKGVNGIKLTPEQTERAAISKRKPIQQYDLNMNFVKEYPSCTEAAKAMGTSVTNISGCANGKCPTAKGYVWIYSDRSKNIDKSSYLEKIQSRKHRATPVLQFTKDMEFVKEYSSIHQAEREVGIPHNNIYIATQTENTLSNGFIWILKSDYEKMLEGKIPMHAKYSKPKTSNMKEVCQFTKQMELVETFDCIGEASRKTDVDNGDISRCANGKIKQAGNFIWIFKEDYQKMAHNEIPMCETIL